MSTRTRKNASKSKIPDVYSPEMRRAILASMARKALEGNVPAARIVLDAIDAHSGESVNQWNLQMISIAELINNPVPDVDLEGLPEVENVQE